MTLPRLHDRRDGADHFFKTRGLGGQTLSTRRRDAIEARAASRLRLAPFRARPPVDQQSLQGRIERALADLEDVGRRLLEMPRDRVAVRGAARQRLEDEHLERAREQFRRDRRLVPHATMDDASLNDGCQIYSAAPMQTYLAEAIGTMMLVLLGDGVVANVVLARTKGQNSGWIVITVGWGVAVAMAVYAVGRISGAHINPAVTIALATIGSFPWRQVPGYIAAQMLGAFVGAVLVWLAYLPHWPATDDRGGKLGVFCTSPAVRSPGADLLGAVVGTMALLFGILAIAANAQTLSKPGDVDLSFVFSRGLQPLLVGVLVLGIGLSLGGPTGYAINPARDLGPRIAHAILPIAGKGPSDWGYAWIPVVAPLIGGIVGARLPALP